MEDGVPVGRTMQSKQRNQQQRSWGKSSSSSRRKLGSGGRYFAGSYKGYGPGVGPAPRFGGAGVAKPLTVPFGKLPAGNYSLPGKSFPWGRFFGKAAGAAGAGFAAWDAWRDFKFAYFREAEGQPLFGGYDAEKIFGTPPWVFLSNVPGSIQIRQYGNPTYAYNPGWQSWYPNPHEPTRGPSNISAWWPEAHLDALGPPVWSSIGSGLFQRGFNWWARVTYDAWSGPDPSTWPHPMNNSVAAVFSQITANPAAALEPVPLDYIPTPESWPSSPPVEVPAVMPWDTWYPAPSWEQQFDYQRALERAPENVVEYPKGVPQPGTNPGVFPEGVVPVSPPGPVPGVSPQRPPPSGTRERKFRSRNDMLLGAFRAVQKGFHSLTEYQDAVDAIYEALPKKLRRELKKKYDGEPNVAQKSWEIFQNFGQINGGEAMYNLLYNHIEDYVIGKGFKSLDDAAKRLGVKGTYKLEQPVMEAINYLRGYIP